MWSTCVKWPSTERSVCDLIPFKCNTGCKIDCMHHGNIDLFLLNAWAVNWPMNLIYRRQPVQLSIVVRLPFSVMYQCTIYSSFLCWAFFLLYMIFIRFLCDFYTHMPYKCKAHLHLTLNFIELDTSIKMENYNIWKKKLLVS